MPFEPIDHKIIPPSFTSVYSKFSNTPYDLTVDQQVYAEDIKKAFEMVPLDNDTISRILSGGISQFSLSDVACRPEDQEARLRLSERARDIFAQEIIGLQRGHAELVADVGKEAAANLERFLPYLRTGEPEFNREFLAACSNEATLDQAKYKEVMRSLKEFGVNSPKDFAALGELNDEKLLEVYLPVNRVLRMIAELQYLPDSPNLTEDQRTEIAPYIALGMSFAPVMEHRLNLMANPLYPLLDYTRLYEKNPSILDVQDAAEALKGTVNFGKGEPFHHALGAFMTSVNQLSMMNGMSIWDRAFATYPELKGAALNIDRPDLELQTFRPVVAHTRDGQALVLTNSTNPKLQTVREYSTQLSDRAIQADKWLLTGSKQFADMMKAHKEFNDIERNPNSSTADKEARSKALAEAATAYLEHKGLTVVDPFDVRSLLHYGKNQREQSRLEVAAKILYFAKAESTSLEKLPETEKVWAAEAKAARPAKIRASLTNTAAGKNDIPNLVTDLLGRPGPKMKVTGEDGTKKVVDVLPQQDLSALYALACGSDKVYYKVVNSKASNKNDVKTFMNKNPEETYAAMLQGVCSGQSGSDIKQNMMTAAMSRVFHCLNSRNYEELGQLLADGLKMNNKVMQNQKGFTPEFFVCAKLGEQALQLMAKNPDIKAAAENFLGKEDLQMIKSGAALSELHTKGVQAFGRLYNRFQMEDKELAFKGIEEDLAYLCQMRGVSKQLAGNKLDLGISHYGKIKDFSSQINQKLAGNEPMTGFIKDLATKSPKILQ